MSNQLITMYMKKAAIYARVSTAGQEEQKTIESQLSELRSFAQNNNFEIVEEYIDDGWSGGSLARPELDRLRDEARSGCSFEVVLILHPDRLSRKFLHQGMVLEELKKKFIDVKFLNRPDATGSVGDNLMLGFEGLFAEYEKERILERTRRGKFRRARSGNIVTSIAPYGYTYVKRTDSELGYLKVNDKEAMIVELIFRAYVHDGLSIRGIIKELYNRKITPRNGSPKWSQSTLHRMIRNEAYIGTAYYNKNYSFESDNSVRKYKRHIKSNKKLRDKSEWIPIVVPSIIDSSTFHRAQELLKVNGSCLGSTAKNFYLLSGKLRCGTCKSTYSGERSHGKLFYRCNNRHKTFPLPVACSQKMISAPKLEADVWSLLSEKILDAKTIEDYVTGLLSKLKGNKENVKEIIRSKQAEREAIMAKKSRILDLFSEGSLPKGDYQAKRLELDKLESDLTISIDKQSRELAEVEGRPLLIKGIKNFCRLAKKRMERLSPSERKTFLGHLIDEIIYSGSALIVRGVLPVVQNRQESIIQKSGIVSPMF